MTGDSVLSVHEPDTTNPDQGGPAWQVTVDARDLHDILQVIPADVRETPQWKNLDQAAGTAGEPQQPVNVPAVRCLVTQQGQTVLDLWLPVGIATDVPIPIYGPITMTLMPIADDALGRHGRPDPTEQPPSTPPAAPSFDMDLESAIGQVLIDERVATEPVFFARVLGKIVEAIRGTKPLAPAAALLHYPGDGAPPIPLAEYLAGQGLGSARSGSGHIVHHVGSWRMPGGSGGYGVAVTRGTAVEVDVTNDQLNLHVMLEGGPPWTLDPIEAELLAVDLQRAARMLDAR